MTEAEWGASTNVTALFSYLNLRRPSPRKLRLFACACVRRVLDLTDHPPSRRAIKIAEEFADGVESEEELMEAVQSLVGEPRPTKKGQIILASRWAATPPSHFQRYFSEHASTLAASACRHARREKDEKRKVHDPRAWRLAEITEMACHAAILRDIFGDALQGLTAAPLSHYNPTLKQMAQLIYDRRSFEDLPILADALEEAGCDNADILNHCRQPSEHVRGCWALDAILGKV